MRFKMFVFLSILAFTAGVVWAHSPDAEPPSTFALSLDGPEGLAVTRKGDLVVGSSNGQIRSYKSDGTFKILANVGEALAGITELKDGRILAASLANSRVWSITPSGITSVFATVNSPNFIVQTGRKPPGRKRRIFVSSSLSNSIVEITNGTPTTVLTGLSFPNGMAMGRHRYLYVAETALNRVSRFQMNRDGSFGPLEVYKTGLSLPDGIAFDRRDNLLVVGNGLVQIIDGKTRALTTLPSHLAFNYPSNIAFGRGRGGFRRTDVFVANFGPGLGDGTSIAHFTYNHHGARLIR